MFPCSKGSYCPSRSSSPQVCTSGFLCDGSAAMIPCPAGYYCPAGTVNSLKCKPGTYCVQQSGSEGN